MQRHAAEVKARLFAPRTRVLPCEQLAEVPVEASDEAPTAKAWAKPQVEQVSFISPESLAPKSFSNLALHPVRRMTSMVCFVAGVSQADIRSHRRTAHVVKARQILFFVCKTYTLYSLPEIGRRTGGKDHTTVLHGIRRVQDAIQFLNIETCDDPVAMAVRLWATDWPRWAR
jgi:hypothetical protein